MGVPPVGKRRGKDPLTRTGGGGVCVGGNDVYAEVQPRPGQGLVATVSRDTNSVVWGELTGREGDNGGGDCSDSCNSRAIDMDINKFYQLDKHFECMHKTMCALTGSVHIKT